FKASDLFGKFLAMGITLLIFVQFFINIGVVIGLLPVTGITLPFLSYGGSSLTVTLLGVGIILNISKHQKEY
ncbi:MAG TPA: FtsW/RodA/SpoVE family cell cycle protein, partial [Haloplasmataceae bacterium]